MSSVQRCMLLTTVFLCTTNWHVLELPVSSRVEWFFIFLKSKSKILFACTPQHARHSFHFQKIPGGLNINIFWENWHKASFYNFFWVLKTICFTLEKRVLVLEEKHPKKLFDPQNSQFLNFETTTLKIFYFFIFPIVLAKQ